ncbi:ornithine carbamoyltransferase [Cladochytrium tenue]|nr:ornithine carbamoyltransferase [Cladochytrium tenue]
MTPPPSTASLLAVQRAVCADVRHFLTLRDFSAKQLLYLLQRSLELKAMLSRTRHASAAQSLVASLRPAATTPATPAALAYDSSLLAGRSLGLLFSKRSTRTRVSAETAWAALGGHPLFLGRNDIQLGDGGESWEDTAVVTSSMLDAILARVGPHSDIQTLAEHSSVPVINALSDSFHPLQALADAMTIYEAFPPAAAAPPPAPASSAKSPLLWLPKLAPLKLAWVGDANNIINSLLFSLPRLGASLAIATPNGYPVDSAVLATAATLPGPDGALPSPAAVQVTHDPQVALRDADLIVTDTWISMGQESEKARRLADFAGFQVSEAMARAGGARPGWRFMHCLPRKPEEVDDDVFYNPDRSLVFQEAENRKYTVMAVFEVLFEPKDRPSGFWELK